MRTLPRPKGRSTRAIVTVYDIPRQPSVIHDLDVDSAGNVWYGNTGWNYLGKLDPKTAMFSEYSAPTFASPSSVEGLMDVQVDAEDHVWAVVQGPKFARFNTRTLTWTSFDPPPGSSPGPFVAPFRISTAPPTMRGRTETGMSGRPATAPTAYCGWIQRRAVFSSI